MSKPKSNTPDYSTIGFRFSEASSMGLYELFAVGRDLISSPSYRWEGQQRSDGPLFLFQYTISGNGRLRIGSKEHLLSAETAFLVEIPGDHCYYFAEKDEPWEFIFLLFRPNGLSDHWNAIKSRCGTIVAIPREHSVIRTLELIYLDARDGQLPDAFRASSSVYRFMMELRRFADEVDGTGTQPEAIRKALDWMEKHYASVSGIEAIAEASGLSKFHFIRRFTSTVGITPLQYLTKVRIGHAIRLLRETDHSIEDIACNVGFSGGSYFIKVFHGIVGCSPGEFRKEKSHLAFHRLFFD
ncbi:AraC family transcriptional regulator [Paenibacillus vini]|uniref:AraC family transcriptional regulator n=1 Tax=Paenibacillus vini TaxID=1476024 RepID=UPI0025B71CB9|nr:AraC family transcriptional regulator [Paenibacillus vini]MDN4068814.1 AraC family transcriptional regulator [Paenibacillus vini]